MKIVMLGPPGVGKGTQSQMLSKDYGIPQVSTGDILREAIGKNTVLGKKARNYLERGDLVPDYVMLKLVKETLLGESSPKGFILDGFPRTVAQAEGLSKLFRKYKIDLDTVIFLNADSNMIINRLSSRRICRKCGAVYNLISKPPKSDRKCDLCQGDLHRRDDDSPETIQNRLDVYKKQTEPLIDFYRSTRKLKEVDGSGSTNEIYKRIKGVLGG